MKSQAIRTSERLKTKIKREIEMEDEILPEETRIVDITSATEKSHDKICLLLRCRLCAIPNNDMIDLFSLNSIEDNLVEKIEHCLCILVKESDALPKQICSSCLSKLELCYNFNETVAEAEKQLLVLHEQVSGRLEETEKNCPSSTLSDAIDQHSIASTNLKACSVVLVPTQIQPETQSINNLDVDSRENSTDDEYQIVESESTKGKKKTDSFTNTLNRSRSQEKEKKIPTSHCETRVEDVWMKNLLQQENLAVTEEESSKGINEHILIDTSERRWQCDNCKKNFQTRDQLRIHSKYYCKKWSGTSKPLNKCDVCAKTFAQKRSLIDHMKLHTSADELYKCKYCSRKFSRTSNRNRHQLSHTDVRPYKCSICEKTFNVPSKLRCHEVIHSDERNYPCSVCTKSFKLKSGLKVHMVVHTGEKPWQCDYCKRSFTRKTTIRSHVKICKHRY